MKKTFLSLLLITLSCIAFAKHEVKATLVLKNHNTVLKHQHKHASNKIKVNKKLVRKLLHNSTLSCYLQGYAWASTFELECSDGGSSTYVVSGISWELFCPEYGIYTTFSTNVESSPSDGGC
jgi:hypothetical protein